MENTGRKRRVQPVWIYSIIVSLGGFIFGYDASVVSGAIGKISIDFSLSPIQQGLVVGAPTFGAILSTTVAGYIADTIGRRTTLMGIALIYFVSALFSAMAPNYEVLVLARFIGGLAFCSLMLAPLYIAEISPAKKRGVLVSVNQLNIVLGFSAAYFSNFYINRLANADFQWVDSLAISTETWRWMFGVEIVPALLYFLLLFTIPKSPRWLIVNKRLDEAHIAIGRLHPALSQHEISAHIQQVRSQSDTIVPPLKERLREIVGPYMRRALIIGLIVGIAQQATGVNAVYFYAPSIFEQSGSGTDGALAQAIWVGIINVIFTVVAMLMIDKLGRKPILILGLAGVVLSMSLCAYGYKQATYTLDESDLTVLQADIDVAQLKPYVGTTFTNDVAFKRAMTDALGERGFQQHQSTLIQLAVHLNATLILTGILGFVASFAFSLGPVMWVMFSEIFPNHIRGLAISFVGVINSVVSFIVQVSFPWELANLGSSVVFSIYAMLGLIGLVLVIWRVPETKGKTLEELEQFLTHSTGRN